MNANVMTNTVKKPYKVSIWENKSFGYENHNRQEKMLVETDSMTNALHKAVKRADELGMTYARIYIVRDSERLWVKKFKDKVFEEYFD